MDTPNNVSVFDPSTFAQMTFTGAASTETVPIPVGEWAGEIIESKIASWQNKEKTNGGLKHICAIEIKDDSVATITGRKKNVVRLEYLLDLTPEGGLDLAKGCNVQLGRLQVATGLDTPGMKWTFDMFVGRNLKVTVKHDIDDRSVPPRILARAVAVAKA